MTSPSDKPGGATFAVSEKNGVRRWTISKLSRGPDKEDIVVGEDTIRYVDVVEAKAYDSLKANHDRIVALKDAEIKERNAKFLRDTEYGLHVRDELLCRIAEKDRIIERLKAALEQISTTKYTSYDSNSGGSYGTGVVDGHRLAAAWARNALAELERGEK